MLSNPNEILTWGGISVDPFDAAPEQIDITDIAHSLSLLCRANGHIRHFYSVAQHCLNCEQEAGARGLSPRIRLFCLLHDASECYISDLIRPVKRRFPLYSEGEARLQRVIFEALGIDSPTPEEWSCVGAVDDSLLYHEFLNLRGTRVFDQAPPLFARLSYDWERPDEIEARYLAYYHRLSGR